MGRNNKDFISEAHANKKITGAEANDLAGSKSYLEDSADLSNYNVVNTHKRAGLSGADNDSTATMSLRKAN